MLNTPESFRANFKAFRVRVLEKANKDINGMATELSFEWESVKRGKAVVAVRFVFGGKKKALLQKEQAVESHVKEKRQDFSGCR